jgi:hypothetical protein
MSRNITATNWPLSIPRLIAAIVMVAGTATGLVLVAAPAVEASITTPVRTVDDPAVTAGDLFGANAAVSGRTAVVGAPGPEDPGEGNAYIYDEGPGRWPATPTVSLHDPAATAGDGFGAGAHGVDVSGNTVIVGAYGTDSGAGAAYLYVRGPGGWPTTPTVSLADPATTSGDNFGYSVSLSGHVAIVGTQNGEAAYIYEETPSGWPATPTVTLHAPATGLFGSAVSISGDTAIVGAYDAGTADSGIAYVYVAGPSGWPTTPTVTWTDPKATADDVFGSYVAVSGSTALISDVGDSAGDSAIGTAYLYARGPSGWPASPTVTLQDPADKAGDLFSASLAVSGDMAVVGDGANSGTDAVYVYVENCSGWPSTPTVTLPDPQTPPSFPGDGFGAGVSVSGTTVLIGAPRVNDDEGVAYFYQPRWPDRNSWLPPHWRACYPGFGGDQGQPYYGGPGGFLFK